MRRPLRRPLFLPDVIRHAQHAFDIPCVDISPNPPLSPFWLYSDWSFECLITDRKSNILPSEVPGLFAEYVDAHADSAFYFTDGFCIDGQVGSAVTGPGFTFKARLSDFSTVFSAEVYAIKTVLIHIKERHVLEATICTDSKSTLQAL